MCGSGEARSLTRPLMSLERGASSAAPGQRKVRPPALRSSRIWSVTLCRPSAATRSRQSRPPWEGLGPTPLRHASASETLDTYAHLWPDSDDLTGEAVDEVLGASVASVATTASRL